MHRFPYFPSLSAPLSLSLCLSPFLLAAAAIMSIYTLRYIYIFLYFRQLFRRFSFAYSAVNDTASSFVQPAVIATCHLLPTTCHLPPAAVFCCLHNFQTFSRRAFALPLNKMLKKAEEKEKSSDNFSVNFLPSCPTAHSEGKEAAAEAVAEAEAVRFRRSQSNVLRCHPSSAACSVLPKGSRRVATRLDSSPLLAAHKEKKNFVRLSLMLLLLLYTKVAFSNGLPKVSPLSLSPCLLRRGISRAPSGAAWLELGIK